MREITDFKPFIPLKDFEVSKAFYECIGFTVNWDNQASRYLWEDESVVATGWQAS